MMRWSMPLQDSSGGDMTITDQEQLEERMSRPTDADIAAIRTLEGDVLILGVGGKMGPTLAQLIRRSADAADKKIRVMGVARFSDKAMPEALRAHGVEPIRLRSAGAGTTGKAARRGERNLYGCAEVWHYRL
jgi:hypothetical protein